MGLPGIGPCCGCPLRPSSSDLRWRGASCAEPPELLPLDSGSLLPSVTICAMGMPRPCARARDGNRSSWGGRGHSQGARWRWVGVGGCDEENAPGRHPTSEGIRGQTWASPALSAAHRPWAACGGRRRVRRPQAAFSAARCRARRRCCSRGGPARASAGRTARWRSRRPEHALRGTAGACRWQGRTGGWRRRRRRRRSAAGAWR